MGSFDSLNPFPVKGSPAAAADADLRPADGSSPDEPSTAYGLIAEWVSLSRRFLLRHLPAAPQARASTTASRSRRGRDLLARGHQEGVAQLSRSTTRT